MTYKRAQLIQRLIEDVNNECEVTSYETALIPDPTEKGEYKVALFSRKGSRCQLMDLVVFANSLYNLGCSMFTKLDEIDISYPDKIKLPCVTLE